MAKETERRYLVRSEEWKQASPPANVYRQGYLSLDPERSVRIRTTKNNAVVTIKGKRKGLARPEFEYPIPVRDAQQILEQLCLKPLITKTRYKLRQNGQLWEIDEFGEENRGLLVAEAESKSGTNHFRKPPWVGEEISGKEQFDNINLVQHPFTTWPENGGAPEAKYHLKSKESISEGVSRALQEQLQVAIHSLRKGGDLSESIHDARKALKKTRALLRLGRSGLGSAYDEANSKLRDLGRRLSCVRDAVALVESATRMQNEEEDKNIKASAQRAQAALRERQDEITRQFVEAQEKEHVIDGLQAVVDESAAWPIEQIDFPAIMTGVKNTIKNGRKALRTARSDAQPENFHEWRKRAKDFRYHVSFLRKLWPEVLDGYADSAKDLEQKLGEDHNLAVLSSLLKNFPLTRRDKTVLAGIIKNRQDKLRKEALEAGTLLYKEGPKHWSQRLMVCWQMR
ncbi:MAG TPA: CHAD domain-containing protein [Bryobacteraceae bacterium]|jgi:CYTH domain-containing protein/CHAD domain-containing protein|nr:CHAD domain-containing protein [Bryobacteraceae bacterium]